MVGDAVTLEVWSKGFIKVILQVALTYLRSMLRLTKWLLQQLLERFIFGCCGGWCGGWCGGNTRYSSGSLICYCSSYASGAEVGHDIDDDTSFKRSDQSGHDIDYSNGASNRYRRFFSPIAAPAGITCFRAVRSSGFRAVIIKTIVPVPATVIGGFFRRLLHRLE